MKRALKQYIKRGISLTLAVVATLALAACGSREAGSAKGDKAGREDGPDSIYTYVPEFSPLEQSENGHINTVVLRKDGVYYTTYSYDVETGKPNIGFAFRSYEDLGTEEVLALGHQAPEGYDYSMNTFFFDNQENLYVFWSTYPVYVEGQEYDHEDNATYLTKFDAQRQKVWEQQVDSAFKDEANSYIQTAVVSSEGKIYGASNNVLYVFDAETGVYSKTISVNTDWINGLVATDEGRVFTAQYGNRGMELVEVNTATDTLGDTFDNLPDGNGMLKPGAEGKILVSGYGKLYEYDLAAKESAIVLDWVDCNIDGNYIREFCLLADDKFAVFYDNYNDAPEVVLLTKTERSKVPQRKEIVLATLYEGSSTLQQAVVAFNKSNSEYKVVINAYVEDTQEWTENTYYDALNRLNADLVGKDSPDLIDLSYVDINNLVGKGVLEDLTPYMAGSLTANAEKFVPSILEAYRIDGVQVAVPKRFNVSTLLAKSSLVGEEPGWTLDDVMALAEAHPDAKLMQYVNQMEALRLCMMYSSNGFIDYETGKCSFDSPEFIKVLEFANGFGEWKDTEESFPSMIQSDRILLSDTSCGDVQEYQMYNLMFQEEATPIGYPTFDGSPGIFINGNEIYGISSQSAYKDGAWAFLESVLADDKVDWGFPSRKDLLEKVFEKAMTPEYQRDEKGEIAKDESGEPIEMPKTTWGYDNWETEIFAASQEEIDEIRFLIDNARLAVNNSEEIFSMISEEAEGYFAGQKSPQDVAKIIQSRVELYVKENN